MYRLKQLEGNDPIRSITLPHSTCLSDTAALQSFSLYLVLLEEFSFFFCLSDTDPVRSITPPHSTCLSDTDPVRFVTPPHSTCLSDTAALHSFSLYLVLLEEFSLFFTKHKHVPVYTPCYAQLMQC